MRRALTLRRAFRRLALLLPLVGLAAVVVAETDDFIPSTYSTASLVIVVDETSCSWILSPNASATPTFGTRVEVKPGGTCEVRP